jgi:hypothetical protein
MVRCSFYELVRCFVLMEKEEEDVAIDGVGERSMAEER